ncbi:MAG: DUF1232 domain-containing protein [Gemmatirosa sp.]|nr:DUF1232 domain-containing protein [Gemmatirosa sp.]
MTPHRNPVGRAADAAGGAAGRAAGRARDAVVDRVRDGVRDVRRAARTPRTGAKRTVLGTIRQIPAYLRLLGGLLTDRRVSIVDKLLVAAAIAYIVAPVDLIPDFVPFLGEVDDVFLLVTALQRLIANAGRRVLLDHWSGNPRELRDLNLHHVLQASAFFLPLGIQRRLRRVADAEE